jgi:hypothetical protein
MHKELEHFMDFMFLTLQRHLPKRMHLNGTPFSFSFLFFWMNNRISLKLLGGLEPLSPQKLAQELRLSLTLIN